MEPETMLSLRLKSLLAGILAACLILSAYPLVAQPAPVTPPHGAVQPQCPQTTSARPKLVVVVVIDQFRYDYLERFKDLFGAGGFRRLTECGALFTEANYDYIPTNTAPGHAAIFTGSIPAQDGIIGNSWFDRATGKVRAMVSDNAAHEIRNDGAADHAGSASPRTLIGTTIGDQLRLATNFQSKVIAVSLKDRAAVLPGGQRPNGAFWFSTEVGSFVSSDYYFKELPAWVKQFNTSTRPDRYFGAHWERALTEDAYRRSQSNNIAAQKSALGKALPYVVTGGTDALGPKFYSAFELTPFASEYLANFAKAAIEGEPLGAGQFPDLLSISFSTPDLVGHAYGPDSQEMEDTYIRLDRVLQDFLNFVDQRVGLGSTLVVLTGDHGVSPVPEYLQSKGMEADRISSSGVEKSVNDALTARFGQERWVQALVNEQLYLDQAAIRKHQLDSAAVERLAGEAALGVPGIVNYFARSQILEGRMPDGPLSRRVAHGFNRQRSGDVWLITGPFELLGDGADASLHGSPYNYDTHVPIVLFGPGVRKGRYNAVCSPSDIAPTLAVLLGIEPPNNRFGRVLDEAVRK
jgi:predicted AlkP superfamily pyrophosphatase or phosphodiesterase